ncbi:MAG TPA: stage 0 sporulation family protein [Clostridia bacterium]|jgi:cell fate regulator YaaT (PSP1 superfamily)|nr:stage 0 sporulation family protein [Clostridia bacterium]
MAIVVGIKFRTGQKIYYFDPNGIEFKEGDNAIVETARGVEFGKVVFGNKEVKESETVQPLKPVIRKATPKDIEQHEKNLAERERIIGIAVEKVNARNLPMKIVDAEYTFDRAKVIIYFTAESRIDFRELVKELASVFHLRIELRQIYEREDIKLRGALAPCGRPCCCTTFLQDYEKVSIKMAKLQGLSLSPNKISGYCGKLMCCLRYENEYYQETAKKMPKIGSVVTTPEGKGTAVGVDFLRCQVKIRFEGEDGGVEIKNYPLCKLIVDKEQLIDDIKAEIEDEAFSDKEGQD